MSENVAYETLTLSHPFMFGKIAMDKTYCQIILSSLLNEEIHLDDDPIREKFIQIKSESKFIRLDLFAKDTQSQVYNAEMQNLSKNSEKQSELPKRSRYYQSLIDAELLDSGIHYRFLNKSYVIFICTFDPFDEGLYRYTFQNRCDEIPELTLGDECIKIFYNTKGDLTNAPEKTRAFLEYLESQKISNKDMETLNNAVSTGVLNEEWRAEYMIMHIHDMDMMEEGRIDGISQGLYLGEKKNTLTLIQKKIAKSKSLEQIAEELEEDISSLQPLYDLVIKNPEKTVDELLGL
ncbi:MAG: Rpn family recombination-promoting nuclease/putative transposase [Lachnospiraceae bacterium]|nr:Rpn family recombination-promoting nuclease/putative transposase [Lachnospiraceae bacterium]